MQMKCVAIDNEPWALELIKKYVSKIPFLELLQTSADPVEAIEYLQNNQVDLLFVDVNIPKAIELLGSLINKPITIFVSAYKKYALEGFDFGALDYLLKPVDFERFSVATKRAIELFKYKQYAKHDDEDCLFVRAAHKTIRIQLNEIEYIEAMVDYIRLHLVNEKPILTLMSLKSIMEKLPADKFRRIHRSYVVPVSQIREVQNKKVILFSSIELPVSGNWRLLIG